MIALGELPAHRIDFGKGHAWRIRCEDLRNVAALARANAGARAIMQGPSTGQHQVITSQASGCCADTRSELQLMPPKRAGPAP
ncbi:hypothetical protein [Pelagibius sp. 7325]|uniref:hypothetical protein n=1 Tax=Pelagibius sp. 7325 TaxID=3131994 RepID=UPI00346132DA